ncbi:MAG: flagellar biosynthesis protein FliQ [Calditrichaeota bacterium]|jgi:flagellar biosynthesis protein FliQ|nr:flagellar biosynthesis protein FliQ [Calditrichota bacterium]
MNVDYVLFLGKETLMTAAYLLAPILGAGLLVGLTVGIFQAVTQINEMTLSFIPKIAVVGFVLILLIPWFLDVLLNFTQEIYNQIPNMIE